MRKYYENWESLDSRPIPSWFNQSKFGIFIHWGVYSVPSYRGLNSELFGSYAEWYYASVYGKYRNHDIGYHDEKYGEDFIYRDFAKYFTAEFYDPDKWAKLFKNSGAKYVVITSKHHDGYCLWPTKNKHKQNWRVTDVGPDVDIIGSLKESLNKEDLKLGLYYSMIDWETNRSHRVDGGYFIRDEDAERFGIDEEDYPEEILLPQLKEIVNEYQPYLLFSDGGEWDLSEEYTQTKSYLTWLYNESPSKDYIVVNDRFFKGMPGKHGDYFSTEYKDKDGFTDQHPWEESRGIGQSYGYNRAESLEDYCSFEEIINEFTDVVSKGGNFLLNVGPTFDGRIPVIQEERLTQIGKWMGINSESIYDSYTGEGTFVDAQSTKKDDNYYVFLFDFIDKIRLKKDLDIANISILGIEGEVKYKIDEDEILLELPKKEILEKLVDNEINFLSYVLKVEVNNDEKK